MPGVPGFLLPESLFHWQQSGDAFRWVDQHQGQWTHQDFLDLLQQLDKNAVWPADVETVGRGLGETRLQWQNLQRWQEQGEPLRWVESQQGQWSHESWLVLLEQLRQ